jgi:hypothetical protein
VVATFFLAGGEALLLLGLFELIWRSAGRKWMPQLSARYPSLIADSNVGTRTPGAPQRSA